MEKLNLAQEWDKVSPKNSKPVGAIRQACCFLSLQFFIVQSPKSPLPP